MEAILGKLVTPNNEVIQQGTLELKEAFKQPSAIPELCNVLSSSATPQIRQYAALLLRKKLSKQKTWRSIGQPDREALKAGCIETLMKEPDKTVQHSIVQLIGVLAKHDLSKNQWPALMPFVEGCFQSEEPGKKSLAMFMASSLCESCPQLMKDHFMAGLAKMFQKALTDFSDLEAGFYATQAMNHLVPYIGSEELRFFQPLVGNVTCFVRRLIEAGAEEKAATAMEIYDDLFESEVSIVVPHIKPIVEMCMVIAACPERDDALRVKAISFIGSLTRMKKKTIVKHKLYIQMINVLFPIMCTIRDSDEASNDEDSEEELENDSPNLCAAQTLDVLAINLPPEKYMSALMAHLTPALNSSDPALLKGAFEAIAVSAEGCSDHIRKKHLTSLLKCIGMGIKHQVPAVRNAALYALGQFSEYMQPEINEYANDILPVLIHFLDSTCAQIQNNPHKKEPLGIDRVFYALQIYAENMEKKLTPFLPELMSRLLTMAAPNSGFPINVKELAISGIGSVANAVKGAMVQYFNDTIVPLKGYLLPQESEEGIRLLTQSMETLSCLARAVGPTNFVPSLAEECCKLGIDLMQAHDDPDVRKAAFSLFGAVAFVAKASMESILPGLVDQMLIAATSKEGMTLEMKEEDNSGLPLEALSDDEEDDEVNGEISLETESSIADLEKIKAVSVENSYMEEKSTAIAMLKEMCSSCGPKVFLPFIPRCLEEIWNQMDYPHEDIRKEAVGALAKFCSAYYIDESTRNLDLFHQCASKLVPALCKTVAEDTEVDVVCASLDAISDLLKTCKEGITNIPGHCEEIIQCMNSVIQSRCACMDSDLIASTESNEEDSEEQAEQDEVLFEYAGDILPSLGLALNQPEKFKPYFAGMLGHLLKKTKNKCTTAEKSFAAGSLAECMEPLHGQLEAFVPHVMPALLKLVYDEDDDVRNNSIFGLGELVLHAGPVMNPHFSQLLELFSKLLSTEKAPRVLDQIVGAVSRLILANQSLVPLDAVLPVLFQHLPLRQDLDEYEIVFSLLSHLQTQEHPIVNAELVKVVNCSLQVIGSDEEFNKEKVLPIMLNLVKRLYNQRPDEMQTVLANCPEQDQAKILIEKLSS